MQRLCVPNPWTNQVLAPLSYLHLPGPFESLFSRCRLPIYSNIGCDLSAEALLPVRTFHYYYLSAGAEAGERFEAAYIASSQFFSVKALLP